jgi:hypothetical protein
MERRGGGGERVVHRQRGRHGVRGLQRGRLLHQRRGLLLLRKHPAPASPPPRGLGFWRWEAGRGESGVECEEGDEHGRGREISRSAEMRGTSENRNKRNFFYFLRFLS